MDALVTVRMVLCVVDATAHPAQSVHLMNGNLLLFAVCVMLRKTAGDVQMIEYRI